MSFSTDLKTELCALKTSPCCAKAEALGMLLYGRAFSGKEISLLTELEPVARRYCDAVRTLTGVEPVVRCSSAGNFKIYVDTPDERQRVLEAFGYTGKEITLRVNHANFENTSADETGEVDGFCCFRSFIRGAFLVCGSVTEPEREYHLEFAVSKNKLATDLAEIAGEAGMTLKTVLRGNLRVLYSKEADAVEQFIGLMGAGNSFVKLMRLRALKEIKNQTNRRTNFEAANLSRTIETGLRQTQLIEAILTKIQLTDMTDDLAALCRLRLENSDASLDELGRLMDPPLSRSAVSRRFRKLEEIAAEVGVK